MKLSFPNVAVLDIATCDFAQVPAYSAEQVLQTAQPNQWKRYFESSVSKKMIAEIGVEKRHLTHLPGTPYRSGELDTYTLARSAVERLLARNEAIWDQIDAVYFHSVSSSYPTGTVSAFLAKEFGLKASCADFKSGCSGGLFAVVHAAAMSNAGARYTLVVASETLSKLAPPDDLRMLLSVGDGAACALIARKPGAHFHRVVHGTDGQYSKSIYVPKRFPPEEDAPADTKYQYEFCGVTETSRFLQQAWVKSFHETFEGTRWSAADVKWLAAHQTTVAAFQGYADHAGFGPEKRIQVVHEHGNMGAVTPFVALSRALPSLQSGDLVLWQAVGGGVSWCSILLEA